MFKIELKIFTLYHPECIFDASINWQEKKKPFSCL